MDVVFPWGADELRLRLPARWRLLGTMTPRAMPPGKDAAAECEAALAAPIGGAPLGVRDLRDKRVVIVVDDHTRPTPVGSFIAPILQELSAAGATMEDISFLVATGVHRPSSAEEVSRKLGADISARYEWKCHDAQDRAGLRDLGRTRRGTPVWLNAGLVEADLIVCLGAAEPHLLAGFSGGLKALVPGCAGSETIGFNHLQGTGADRFDYVGAAPRDTPMRADLEEAAGLLGDKVFVVNAVLDESSRPARFFCGDPIEAHRAAVDHVQQFLRVEVPEPADIVLTNSFPMDADLRQSAKCIGNALYAAKPNGVVLGCARCANGLGELPLMRIAPPYGAMRALARLLGGERILPAVRWLKRRDPIEEVFLAHLGLQMMRRNHLALYNDTLPDDVRQRLPMAHFFSRVEAMLEWAARRAPAEAAVLAFPHGGVTYVPQDMTSATRAR